MEFLQVKNDSEDLIMNTTIKQNFAKQSGSFAIEAAFVCLALVCMGLAFFFHASQLIGKAGSCHPNVQTTQSGHIRSVTVFIRNGSGLIGMLHAIKCKTDVVMNPTTNGGSNNKSLKWQFKKPRPRGGPS